MRFRLRTLLIVLAVGPMVFGGTVRGVMLVVDGRERARQMQSCNECYHRGQARNSIPPAPVMVP